MKEVNSTGEKAEFDGVGRPQPRVVVFGHLPAGKSLRRRTPQAVDIFLKNTSRGGFNSPISPSSIRGKVLVPGVPSPTPSKSLDWRGFCKNGSQNLEPQGFRGQNLDNKGLAAFFAVGACTASALTIFYLIAGGGQGQMSHDECGVCGFRGPQDAAAFVVR
jgi:hypothetical protein